METALAVVFVFIGGNDRLHTSGDVQPGIGNHGAFGRSHRYPDCKRYEADVSVPHCKNIPGICNGEQQITGEQKKRKRLQNSHENFCYL